MIFTETPSTELDSLGRRRSHHEPGLLCQASLRLLLDVVVHLQVDLHCFIVLLLEHAVEVILLVHDSVIVLHMHRVVVNILLIEPLKKKFMCG